MGGFVNDNNNYEIVFCDNVNFSGDGTPTGKMTINGQLLIGAATAPFIRPGLLTSSGSTITWTFGAGTINAEVNGSVVGQTITTQDSTVLSPVLGNWNWNGSGSLTTTGSGNTATMSLTGLTNHALLVGAGTATITKVGPSATVGQILQSQGSTTDPAFSTATYPSTTTINQILYSSSANVVGGITAGNNGVLISSATGVPSFLADGTTNQVLVATTGAPPSWGSIASTGAITTITGDSGGAESPSAGNFTFSGGATGLTFAGTAATETLTGTLAIPHGGTSVASVTTTPTATAFAGWDANKNLAANNYSFGFTQNTVLGGTVTLTNASAEYQHFGGTSATLVLPDATTLPVSISYYLDNDASGNVAVEANGGGALFTIKPGQFYVVYLAANGTSAGTWYFYESTNANSVITQYDILVGAANSAIASVGPGSAGQVLQSGGNAANPSYSTATYPSTTTINEILFSSAANTVTGLSTTNDGVLVTSNTGVPSWLANSGTPGYILTANTGAPPSWQPSTSSQMAWVNNPGNITVSNNTGYTISTTTTLTLPASPSIGFSFSCADYGTGNITIQANTGQNINIGNNTSNVAGTASDNGAGSLTLVFNGGSRWIAISLVGTWNLN